MRRLSFDQVCKDAPAPAWSLLAAACQLNDHSMMLKQQDGERGDIQVGCSLLTRHQRDAWLPE